MASRLENVCPLFFCSPSSLSQFSLVTRENILHIFRALVDLQITLIYVINSKHMSTFLLGHALMKHKFAMVCQSAMVPKMISSGAMMLPCGASRMLIGNL